MTRLRELVPGLLIETLLGDFAGHAEYVDATVSARPDVWAHNLEVVRRLQRTVRYARCSYERSLGVLRRVKEKDPAAWTKSSLMVGIGETDEEIAEALADLSGAGVDVVTIGQYLRPSPKHAPVARYVDPATFDRFAELARSLGFAYVASGPLVRSSYKAAEAFFRGKLTAREVRVGPSDLLPAGSLLRRPTHRI